MILLTEKYEDKVLGTIGCYDRVVVMGTLPNLCFPNGMTSLLNHLGVRIFDYAKFAQPYRDLIRENAEGLARANGLKVHYLNNSNTKTKTCCCLSPSHTKAHLQNILDLSKPGIIWELQIQTESNSSKWGMIRIS